MSEAQRLRDTPSPIQGGAGQEEMQGVSRSVLEWDPLAEEYRRRMEPVESAEEAGIGSAPRKYSSAGFDEFSDRASRFSDAGGVEPDGSVHRTETTLVYDEELGQYRKKVDVSEGFGEQSEDAKRHLKRRLTNAHSGDNDEIPDVPTLLSRGSSRQVSQSAAANQSSTSNGDSAKSPTNPNGLPHSMPTGSQQEEDFLQEASKRLFGLTSKPTRVERKIQQGVSPFTERLRRFYRNYMFESIWLILILIGTLMSILAWCIDELTERLFELRDDIGKLPNPTSSRKREGIEKWLYEQDWTAAFFIWWAWAVFFGFGAILIVKYVAPQAAGSGIEQVRSIMTGYPIPGYLEINTLVAKVIGLVSVQASGLTVGKEGPFVHIACSLANLLLSLPMFAEIKKSRALTKQVISAACATGVSSTFGAPVGGVLFAVEVTSNVYHTADYWKAFFTAVCGEVIFRELSYFGTARPSQISLFPTTFSQQPYLLVELPGYIFLSAICGLYGGFYVKVILGVRSWRTRVLAQATDFVQQRKEQRNGRATGSIAPSMDGDEEGGVPDVRERDTNVFVALYNKIAKFCNEWYLRIMYRLLQPMMYAFCVISITAIINWISGQFMKRTLYSAIGDLVVSGEMAQDDALKLSPDHRLHSTDWGSPSLLFNLLMYFVVKSFLCAIALSLPVPTGTLIPMLAIGLAMGRFGGEIAQILFGPSFIPGGYALVGASAFIAGSTGAISTAVIIFEITAQLSYMVPVLMAVIIGRQAGKVISPDLYEALQIMKKLPNIPPLAHQSSYNILAVEVMSPDNIPMLRRFSTLLEIENTLNAPTFRHHDEVHDDDLFALVDDDVNYLGSVSRHQLRGVLTSSPSTMPGEEKNEKFDILTVVDTNTIAPSVPITTPMIDCLNMFELTLCTAMFVTDKCRVVGWLDLNTVRHKCESGEL